ncbi:hypothetical protein ATHL_02964 [Anaerolinea thermolimosa]|uniref:hypothetical protein n=1 Tax=Anaerolinea thermolimosa TaxID=229919 RepID=UPI000784DD80|nr:hypothetical protein [Anaerolinea thermolimosa]GAP08064.1 hypothetical protein ATHL_02964 [Anaerolinea thermolimosa]
MIESRPHPAIQDVIGHIPYRMALAGGWIDQPYISRHNPSPPGSMVVVGLEPDFHFMERSGMASGTRNVARRLWGDRLPPGDPATLVRQLYAAENEGKADPSGSQDMIGLIYPGINRLDYDYAVEGGVFPAHIETCRDETVIAWLEKVIHFLPVMQRPPGYNPLEIMNLEPAWVERLGQTGQQCFAAILARDLNALGASLNACMRCWEALLPATVRHPTISMDLSALLACYQARYPGAMYSGCGGGYLLVVSEDPVPGAFQVRIRR